MRSKCCVFAILTLLCFGYIVVYMNYLPSHQIFNIFRPEGEKAPVFSWMNTKRLEILQQPTLNNETNLRLIFHIKISKTLKIENLKKGDRSSKQAAAKRGPSTTDVAELLSSNSQLKASKPRMILVYTTFFGELPWHFFKQKDLKNVLGTPCPYSNCILSHNRTDFNRSDAVLFHIRNMPSTEDLRALMKIKPAHQRWVFFILENPYFSGHPLPQYNGMFNWTMAYSRDSDIFAPYGYYYDTPSSNNLVQMFDYASAKGKDKLVYWPVSNCGQPREKVALELAKYIPIDVFGSCKSRFPKTKNSGLACPFKDASCDKLTRQYKFRLSFENKNCKDYITEKYWEALERDNVPIVLGGANYDPEVAVPGSFINVLDFPSIKALAEHIKYLDGNDTAYNEYFTWRKKYTATNFDSSFGCGLCTALNLDFPPKVYNDIDKFWGIEQNCGIHLHKMKNMAP